MCSPQTITFYTHGMMTTALMRAPKQREIRARPTKRSTTTLFCGLRGRAVLGGDQRGQVDGGIDSNAEVQPDLREKCLLLRVAGLRPQRPASIECHISSS